MKKQKFSVYEEQYVHTTDLSESEAIELCNRLKSCFPNIYFYVTVKTKGQVYH